MMRNPGLLLLMGMLVVSSCAKKENTEEAQAARKQPKR